MKIENITLIKLTPSKEGMVLTNGTVYATDFVYLAAETKPESYWEITYEEYAEILKKQEEEAAEEATSLEID